MLTNYFIDYFNLKTDLPHSAPELQILEIFKSYIWPGNVRELRNVIEGFFAFAESDDLQVTDIPDYIRESVCSRNGRMTFWQQSLNADVAKLECEIIRTIYEDCKHDLTAAADMLGISKQLLRFKLNKYESEKI